MSMVDLVVINVKTRKIDNGRSLDKDFIELIHMNPSLVLYLTINKVDLCHNCVCDPLT